MGSEIGYQQVTEWGCAVALPSNAPGTLPGRWFGDVGGTPDFDAPADRPRAALAELHRWGREKLVLCTGCAVEAVLIEFSK